MADREYQELLEQAGAKLAATADKPAARKVSQATKLVDLASDAALFRSPGAEPFISMQVDGHRETWPLRTRPVRRWLARLYHEAEAAAPTAAAIQDALAVLEGQALFDGDTHAVHIRVAEHHGALYLDLADERWRAVEVTADGWRPVEQPPVRFRRARGMLALPEPRPGSIELLREFGNFAREEDWMLSVAWLLAALRPTGPFPVLALHGEQGAAKSTRTRLLRQTIDPNKAALRAAPRNGHDLIIAATNGWVVALDNLSHLQDWLSDAICRLATGGGFATRELYSDAEETIFEAQRPAILNGIAELATRGDLQDRAIVQELPRIQMHRTEENFWREFEDAHPRILGALLSTAAAALANMDEVELASLPRMADFAKWAAAAAPAMGWTPEDFLDAYGDNRASANEITLEASPLVGPLRQLVAEEDFEGTATELLAALDLKAEEQVQRSKEWPKGASALSGALRRLAPNLRRADPPVEIEFAREPHTGRRLITVTHASESEKERHPRHPRHPTQASGDGGDGGDGVSPTSYSENGQPADVPSMLGKEPAP